MNIRDAKQSDAKALAYLINLAGEGIPYYLWSQIDGANNDPYKVGEARASRESGGFSYRNARVMENDATVVGMVVSYPLDDPYVIGDLEEIPDIVRPLVILESKAPGTWYINALATAESLRGKGVATQLLANAESGASKQGFQKTSLIVASENIGAKNLYLKLGYQVQESLPVIEYPGCLHGGQWELMTKDLITS